MLPSNKVIHLLRTISGVILGLSPVLLSLVFGLLVYNYQTNYFGITIICLLTIIGVVFGFRIFKIVRKIGFISFITAVRSTQHIDPKSIIKDE